MKDKLKAVLDGDICGCDVIVDVMSSRTIDDPQGDDYDLKMRLMAADGTCIDSAWLSEL